MENQTLVKVQSKGLITIPKEYRKSLRIDDNGFVRIKKLKGVLIVEPVRTLSYPVRSYNEEEVEGFIVYDQEQGKGLL